MAGVGYCLGRVLASDSDDVCLSLLTTGSCCTVGRKEHCARPNGRTHLGWATHLLAYNMRQMDQIIFAKHLWKTSYLVSLYMNQPERRHRTYRIWRALCASVFWAPGPPTHQQGLPRLCVLTTGCREHSWTTANLHDPLRSIPVLVPTNIGCTIRYHVLVTV